MKKFYATLATLAMGGSIMVSAAMNESTEFRARTAGEAGESVTALSEATMEVSGNDAVRKAGAKAQAEITSLYGFWEYTYFDMWAGTSGDWVQQSLEITPGDNPGEAMVYGFIANVPLKATIDEAEMTVSIPEQICGTVRDLDGNIVDLEIITYHWNEGGKGNYAWGEPIVLKYYPDGRPWEENGEMTIQFKRFLMVEDIDAIAYLSNKDILHSIPGQIVGVGGGYLFYGPSYNDYISSLDMSIFEFDSSEWVKASKKALFTDGWFAPVYTESGSMPAYEVDVYASAKGDGEVLLWNPYGEGTPWKTEGINAWKMNGGIILNVSDPDCVMVRPFVPSGFSGGDAQYFCCNIEGYYYYVNGEKIEDLKDLLPLMGYDVSTMDSSYVVNMPTCTKSDACDIMAYSEWVNEDDELIDMISVIELPEELFSGVEGVVFDLDKGVTRYFNLQGMEITAPVAGQVVIEKNGAKSVKKLF